MLGGAPQHTRYEGENSELHIGKNCVIREHVTMHPGTAIDAMKTVVGDNGLFFAGAHVAHDCVVGKNVIFAAPHFPNIMQQVLLLSDTKSNHEPRFLPRKLDAN